jgi:hypothetical protein
MQDFGPSPFKHPIFSQVNMQVKDIGLFLILGICLDIVGIACSTAILVMYKIQPGLRGMFICLETFLALNILVKLIAFNVKLYLAPPKLNCIMFMSVILFTIGTMVVGISFGKANYWEKTIFGGDGASIPLLFLSADILIYLAFIFIVIRSKEVLVEQIRKGEIDKDDPRKIRDIVCGDLYEANDNISAFAGRGKYVHDEYIDRRKKPSFNNKKKFTSSKNAAPGARKRNPSNSSFDGPIEEDRKPILHNPSPRRVAELPISPTTRTLSNTVPQKSTRQPTSPPRQYVQTPSLLDSSISSTGGVSPRRGRVVF